MKWGRMAVFTPAMISGTLSMKQSPLVAWNFVLGAVYVLSVEREEKGPGRAGDVLAGVPALRRSHHHRGHHPRWGELHRAIMWG